MPANGMSTGGGTLRRGMRGIVPPPDVTHHTSNSKSTQDIHNLLNQNGSQQTMNTLSNNTMTSQLSSNNSSLTTPKQPQGILKDPNRKQQQHHHPPAHSNMQILNVQNAPGIGLLGISGGSNPVGVAAYDPNTHSLSSFNASMGYTDADGHLV